MRDVDGVVRILEAAAALGHGHADYLELDLVDFDGLSDDAGTGAEQVVARGRSDDRDLTPFLTLASVMKVPWSIWKLWTSAYTEMTPVTEVLVFVPLAVT